MINYNLIARSIEHYALFGFARVESPWMVPRGISDITRPAHAKDFQVNGSDVLVASGEQSFLALYNLGQLPKGKFQTVTPCFRDEAVDSTHLKCFMKNELIITDRVSVARLMDVIDCAVVFFNNLGLTVVLEETRESNSQVSYDLTFNDIELGSYGIRRHNDLHWIYGTGVAEPRLSRAMKQYGIPY
jgi:hypothetical protein